jgi:hypothetical protein
MDSNEVKERIECIKSLYIHRWRYWKPYMVKYNCDVVCEIGIRTGGNFMKMIEHNPKVAVAVDCWTDDGVVGRNDTCYNQEGLDFQYNQFKEAMADKPFVKICRAYSFDAVKEFPDEYFDFLFIDGDHTYEGISRDLVDWYPKMKSGGTFLGHDYYRRRVKAKNGQIIKFGVIEAVNEFVEKNNIKNFSFTEYPNPIWIIIKE